MIAKTQAKVDQFVAKQRLRRLLKKRSAIHWSEKMSPETKDARDELDEGIRLTREFIEFNKQVLVPVKRVQRTRKERELV
jgi:hypothetical protein